MSALKTLVICISAHHGNTMKVAEKIAKTIGADIISPQEVTQEKINQYEFIGFGSGIYNGRHHNVLFNLLDKLPDLKNKKTFVFSTNTFGLKMLHEEFNKKLKEKGCIILGDFSCRGFSDYSFIKYLFGGINKTHPSEKDLSLVEEFILKISK